MSEQAGGMTLKAFAARRYYDALAVYRQALESGTGEDIIRASLLVHSAQRSKADRSTTNRVFRETRRLEGKAPQ